MRIRITYPGVGLYAKGQARFEAIDANGVISMCRFATDQEVMWWDQLCATQTLTNAILRTYGNTVAKGVEDGGAPAHASAKRHARIKAAEVLLAEAAGLFRVYASNHRTKEIAALDRDKPLVAEEHAVKAGANEEIAGRIEAFLRG